MDLAIAIIGAAAAVAAALAAMGSWRAARRANETAAAVAAIERDRRHDEMTPEFEITCTVAGPPPAAAELYIVLTGGRLERHASVSVTILDEARQEHLPEGVAQADLESIVWGPLQFDTLAGAPVVSARESKPRPYDRVSGKNWDLLALVPTRPGWWMTGMSVERWANLWHKAPLRLLVTCRCEGYDPWFIQREVTIDRPPGARIRGVE